MTRLFSLLAAMVPVCALSQVFTYTNTNAQQDTIPLGFSVPVPVDSLTPVDGFRTYASLHARHQQLAASSEHITAVSVGSTLQGNTIWAYVFDDEGSVGSVGAREGAALINGTIHAREWQSPEGVTALMEWMHDNQQDQYLGSYLRDSLRLVILPVLNIDGFLQTQRFPTMVTDDPLSPRDGRMRRKNMLEADTSLDTAADNLNGVDLNRNNAPYWATNPNRSSSNLTSIVHHGSGPGSAPETQALYAAADLAGEERLRFYTDVHSFSQIYFAPFTGNARRDLITTDIAGVMRAANDYRYEYGPSAAGGGIGATDEYFANTYEIPSYTLEIEPIRSASQYGGFGVSHDGFILPESEVARMRQEVAGSFVAGLYAMAEQPFVKGIEIWDDAEGQSVIRMGWIASEGQRILERQSESPLVSGVTYRMKVVFNKPMRRIEDGLVADFADLSSASGINLIFEGFAGNTLTEWDIDVGEGQWLTESGFASYQTDTFEVSFQLPDTFVWENLERLTLKTTTTDMTGQNLDSDPSTLVDWSNGAWTGYEDTQGNTESDDGGVGLAMRLIDDGSGLFAPLPTTPDTPTTPTTPSPQPDNSSGGGGGSLLWIFGVLLAGLGCRIATSRKANGCLTP